MRTRFTLFLRTFFHLSKPKSLHSKATPVSLRIFLPDRNKHGHSIATMHKEWVDYFTLQFSKRFGGCYIEKVKSYYMTEHLQIIEETTTIINTSCFNGINSQYFENLITTLKEFADTTSQESILYEVNRKSYLLRN